MYNNPYARKGREKQQYLISFEDRESGCRTLFADVSIYDCPRPLKLTPRLPCAHGEASTSSSIFYATPADKKLKGSGKDRSRAFLNHHSELHAKMVEALDLEQYSKDIYSKVIRWFKDE